MTINKLLSLYNCGMLTISEFSTRAMCEIDPNSSDVILSMMPQESIDFMCVFTKQYKPNGAITFGDIPDPGIDKIAAVSRWLITKRSQCHK